MYIYIEKIKFGMCIQRNREKTKFGMCVEREREKEIGYVYVQIGYSICFAYCLIKI